MPGRFGIDCVMLVSVGASPAENFKSLTSLADAQLQLGGNLMKFMNSIRSEAEMDELVNLMGHMGPMNQQDLDRELLPHMQKNSGGKRVSTTCVQDPTNADVLLYCVVIHQT